MKVKQVTITLTEREALVLTQCLNTRQDEAAHYVKNCKRLGLAVLLAKYRQDVNDMESIRHKINSRFSVNAFSSSDASLKGLGR